MHTTMLVILHQFPILAGTVSRSIASSRRVQHTRTTTEASWLDQIGSMRWRLEFCLWKELHKKTLATPTTSSRFIKPTSHICRSIMQRNNGSPALSITRNSGRIASSLFNFRSDISVSSILQQTIRAGRFRRCSGAVGSLHVGSRSYGV